MKNIVTKRQIDELLEKSEIKVETVYDKVTIVNCKLPNGFVITEASGAVDPANYDEKIGTEICMAKIENKLWELEGYVLAKQLYEREETVMKPYIGVKKIEADPMKEAIIIHTEAGRYLRTKIRMMKVIMLSTLTVTSRGRPKKILKTHFLKRERTF